MLRLKPKKKMNRYNPNAPDWNAVHRPYALRIVFGTPR